MAIINNSGVITLNRGDCFKAPLFLNIGTEEEPIRLNFKLFPYMEIYFGIYLTGDIFENSFIVKKFTHLDSNEFGDIMVTINPEDTLYLKPGKYLYSVKAAMHDDVQGDWINTVINRKEIYII